MKFIFYISPLLLSLSGAPCARHRSSSIVVDVKFDFRLTVKLVCDNRDTRFPHGTFKVDDLGNGKACGCFNCGRERQGERMRVWYSGPPAQ